MKEASGPSLEGFWVALRTATPEAALTGRRDKTSGRSPASGWRTVRVESPGDVAGVLGTLGEEWWRQTLARKGVD